MEDEDIAPNTHSWFSRFGQKVAPMHFIHVWCTLYRHDFLPIPTGSAVCIWRQILAFHFVSSSSMVWVILPPPYLQLMVALNSLQTIYVRGSYGPSPQSQARLQAVKLETTQVSHPEQILPFLFQGCGSGPLLPNPDLTPATFIKLYKNYLYTKFQKKLVFR